LFNTLLLGTALFKFWDLEGAKGEIFQLGFVRVMLKNVFFFLVFFWFVLFCFTLPFLPSGISCYACKAEPVCFLRFSSLCERLREFGALCVN